MTAPTDPIADALSTACAVLRAWLASDMGFEQQVVDAICQTVEAQDASVRQRWAGDSPYIPVRSPADDLAQQAAVEEAHRTGRVREAASKYGVARATLYRCLRNRRGA